MTKYVLIAEDDTLLAEMMGNILKKYNVRVTISYNGKQTLEALEKKVPDVLLLDILMPVVDGHAVLSAMQQNMLQCPVIVLTNLGDKMTRDKCKQMHVKKYFVKNDMDDDSLWPAVEQYLR